MGDYRIIVCEGHLCWLVMLTDPSPYKWKVLGTGTQKEAEELAHSIRVSVSAS